MKEHVSLEDMNRWVCMHDGCKRVYSKHYEEIHAANRDLHLQRCTSSCAVCIERGWIPTYELAQILSCISEFLEENAPLELPALGGCESAEQV